MKKVLSIAFIFILSLGLILVRPFDIYADATDGEFDNDSVVGVQVEEYEELLSGVQGTRYRFNIILDGFYVGDFQIHVEYDSYNVSTSNWDHFNIDRTVYVCGYDTYFETWMRSNWLPPSSITWSASVNNSDQCIYVGRMESQQLLNLLIGLRSSYNTNSAVEIGYLNQIDQKITQLLSYRQWSIPFESIPTISYSLYQNYPVYELKNYNNYDFPLFTYSDNDILFEIVSSNNTADNYKNYRSYDILFIFDRAINLTSSSSLIHIDDGQFINQKRLNQWKIGSKSWVLQKATITNFTTTLSGSNSNKIRFIDSNNGGDLHGVILYCGYSTNEEIMSTDFAINFGYTNKLLNDLDIIINGNNSSQSSSSNLEDSKDDLSDVSDPMFTLEDSFNSDMNDALDDIDTTFSFENGFGSKFLSSANFVKNEFDNLTQNTAFGSLLSFSLLLGLGLLIIGKIL